MMRGPWVGKKPVGGVGWGGVRVRVVGGKVSEDGERVE